MATVSPMATAMVTVSPSQLTVTVAVYPTMTVSFMLHQPASQLHNLTAISHSHGHGLGQGYGKHPMAHGDSGNLPHNDSELHGHGAPPAS